MGVDVKFTEKSNSKGKEPPCLSFEVVMAALLRLLLLVFIFSDSLGSIHSLGVGINYGLRSNSSLPPPAVVVSHLQSLNISRVKIYPDPTVISAFANTTVEIIIRVGSEHIQRMVDPNEARKWIEQHVHPYIPQTKIKGITFDEESFIGDIPSWRPPYLLPAMRAISAALTNIGLNEETFVSTVLPMQFLNKTFPPSDSTFEQDSIEYMQNILDFLNEIKSPLFIKAYPASQYRGYGGGVSLEYAIFQVNPGKIDPNTKLHYDNMFYEQIDSVYSAIKALGHTDIKVVVSETGWYSSQTEIAGLFMGNLLDRIQQNQGTPARPDLPLDVYAALFYEDLAPNGDFGLYNPDGTPLYRLGLRGYLPRMDYSSSRNTNVLLLFNLLFPIVLLLCRRL